MTDNPKDAIAGSRVPVGLFPDTAILAGAMGFLEGARKYGAYNWRVAPVRASVYTDALARHMTAWRNGEDIDADSGLPHPWKAICCLAILIDAERCGTLIDDRPPRAPVATMLRTLKDDVARLQAQHPEPVRPYTIADTPDPDEGG